MGLALPRWPELGAKGYEKQRLKALYSLYEQVEHLKARRIDPMHVLENHQNRVAGRQFDESRSQGFERPVFALFGRKLEVRISSVVREGQHPCQERCVLGRG